MHLVFVAVFIIVVGICLKNFVVVNFGNVVVIVAVFGITFIVNCVMVIENITFCFGILYVTSVLLFNSNFNYTYMPY